MAEQIDFLARMTASVTQATIEPWATVGSASLFQGDCLELLDRIPAGSVDVIFADPPYFLSNGGTTCKGGERVSVDKGDWDQSRGLAADHDFNRRWLAACRRALASDGTIWVSGTAHVIFSVGFAIQELGFKLINDVIWEKPNPPPNMGCRCFTHSHEVILWAAKCQESNYFFDYESMKRANGGKQMKDVWRFTAPKKSERVHGDHPTQKPLQLLDAILAASARPGAVVLDPFNGSGTTGVIALRRGLTYFGIDLDARHLATSRRRFCAELGLPTDDAEEVDQHADVDHREHEESEPAPGCLF